MDDLTDGEEGAILLNAWKYESTALCVGLVKKEIIIDTQRLGLLTFKLTQKGKKLRDQLLEEVEG